MLREKTDMLTRRDFLGATAAGLLVAGTGGAASAQSVYPAKPIRLIVPYPPGGSTDIAARVVGEQISQSLGQRFVVDNRPGAGGNIGMQLAATSDPDGYTVVVGTTAHAINMTLFKDLSYDTVKDFEPIALLTEVPLILVVNPAVKAQSVADLIALAKQEPGSLDVASSGNGQSTHLAAELFNAMAGVKMTHVPYKGSAPAITDVVAGHVQLMFDTVMSALPHVQAGKLRALAVTSAKRAPVVPDVPTIAEAALPGYEAIAWNGLFAPKGTPRAIIDQLNAETVKAVQSHKVKEQFASMGATARPTTPDEFASYVRNEVTKWAKVVNESGARIE
jgi:tripartite-type tricarboxylate transporter receptor subunit TctC